LTRAFREPDEFAASPSEAQRWQSTRDARRAGSQLAATATASNPSITIAKIAGSLGDWSNNSGLTHLPAASAITAPIATPMPPELTLLGTTRRARSLPCAPSATRTPISWLRCAHVVGDHAVHPDGGQRQCRIPNATNIRRAKLPRAHLRSEHLGDRRDGHVRRARHLALKLATDGIADRRPTCRAFE